MLRKKKSTMMSGRNESTVPTPLYTPSMMRLCTTGAMFHAVSVLSVRTVIQSMALSNAPCSHAPSEKKVSQNTSPMITRKDGMAVQRPVSILSSFMLRRCSLLSVGYTTVRLHRRWM